MEETRQISGRAVASLVTALVALPISWIPFVNVLALAMAVVAVVQGMKGFRECNRSTHLKGATLAVIGITLVAFVLVIVLVVAFIIEIEIFTSGF